MSPHPPLESLALYVADELDNTAASALEDHVAQCPECGERLAREARLERSLHALGEAAAAHVPGATPLANPIPAAEPLRARRSTGAPVRRRLIWSAGIAASLLLLAGISRWLQSGSPRGTLAPPAAGALSLAASDAGALKALASPADALERSLDVAVACLDASTLEECLRSARAEGRMVQLPAQPAPKYEELAQGELPASPGSFRPLVEGE